MLAVAATKPNGCACRVPAGQYYATANIAQILNNNCGISLVGEGSTITHFIWQADCDGHSISLVGAGAWLQDVVAGTSGGSFNLRGITFARESPGEGRTALTITGTATANPGHRQVLIHDFKACGTAGYSGSAGWANGIALTCLAGIGIDRFYFHSPQNATGIGSGRAISFQGSATFVATDLTITGSQIEGPQTGLYLGQNVQGVTMEATTIISALDGVVADGSAVLGDNLYIHNCHFNNARSVVRATSYNTVIASQNYILAQSAIAQGSAVLFDLTESCRNEIIGNVIFGNIAAAPGQSLVRVTNTGALDTQVSVSVLGNVVQAMSGPLVTLANQTHHAQVSNNVMVGTGSIGTDARGTSTWTANVLNGVSETRGPVTLEPTSTGNGVGSASLVIKGRNAAGVVKTALIGCDQDGNAVVQAPVFGITDPASGTSVFEATGDFTQVLKQVQILGSGDGRAGDASLGVHLLDGQRQ